MKKQLLLLALMLGSQISAQTVKDALHELNGSALEYFKIVNTTAVPEFQERNRSKLNTLLSQDISTVTLDQMEAIKRAIDSVVNTMSSSIKNVSPEDFSDLAEETKEELQEAIEEVIQQAELQRLANESAELQRLEEEMAQQKRLAEAALAQTIAAPTLSIDMMNAGDSTTDPIANPLLPTDRFPQLTEELSSLDETSSTDVDTVLLNHSDILEGFMNERMGNSTEQEYQDALGLLFKTEGIKIDDTILPGLATRLHNMQTMPDYHLEELDEEDMDTLLAQLTPEEADELLNELNQNENRAIIKLKQEANQNSQRTMQALKEFDDSMVNIFFERYQQDLKILIYKKWEEKNQYLDEKECEQLLISFLSNYGFVQEDFIPILPALKNRLSLMEDKMWSDRQHEFDPIEDLEEKANKVRTNTIASRFVKYFNQTKPHHITPITLGINPQTTQSLPSDYPADMEDVD